MSHNDLLLDLEGDSNDPLGPEKEAAALIEQGRT